MAGRVSSRLARLPGLQDGCRWGSSGNPETSMGILATDRYARNHLPQHAHQLTEESRISRFALRARNGVCP